MNAATDICSKCEVNPAEPGKVLCEMCLFLADSLARVRARQRTMIANGQLKVAEVALAGRSCLPVGDRE